MRTISVDLYKLDELDEAAQAAAFDEWTRAMGGAAHEVQFEAEDQGRAIDRFLKAVPWAHGAWDRGDVWRFEPVDASEAVDALDARPDPEAWDWYDYSPAQAFNDAMEARAQKLERAARVYLESTSQERSDRAALILEKACDEALEEAARAITHDWEIVVDDCYSFQRFADASAAYEWEYTAAGRLA